MLNKNTINVTKLYHLVFSLFLVGTNIQAQCPVACIGDLQVSIDADGLAEITVDMIYEGDTTGCNFDFLLSVEGPNGFEASGPSVTLTCDQIGISTVYLTDLNTGNVCWSTIDLQDVAGNCDFGGQAIVASGLCYSELDLLLDGNETITGDCKWILPDLSPGDHTLELIDDNLPALDGVSTLDFMLMYRGFIMGFDDPKQAIATDIDNDGTVSTIDIILQRQLILSMIEGTEFDIVRFARADDPFDNFNPYNMSDYTVLEFHSDEFESANNILVDIIKTGDLNGSASGGLNAGEFENRSVVYMEYEDRYVHAGEQVTVELSIDELENLQGITSSIAATQAQLIAVDSDYSDFEFIHNTDNQALKYSFLATSDKDNFQMNLTLEASQSGYISDMLSLVDDLPNDAVASDLSYTLQLKGLNSTNTNEPPFRNGLRIQNNSLVFEPYFEGFDKYLKVVDVSGRTVLSSKSSQQIIDLDVLGPLPDGIYFLKWQSQDQFGTEQIFIGQ